MAWARERAARGADYLDTVDPDWSLRIAPETLTLDDGTCCVLGQLHGEFRMGLSRAGLFNMGSAPRSSLSPVAYGFHAVLFGDDELQARDYAFLDAAWRDEIRKRRPPKGADRVRTDTRQVPPDVAAAVLV